MRQNTILQVALDFTDLERALKLAREAVEGGCDWLEAGTPLIKSEGLNCIRRLRKMFPKTVIVADMKVMDVGRTEVEMAAKAGANVVSILGCAGDRTIKECVSAGKNYGAKIMVDMIEVGDVVARAKETESMGADFIGMHTSIDRQMAGDISFDILSRVAGAVDLPVAVAGGINSENAAEAVKSGAEIIIVGGAVTKSQDAKKAVKELKRAITGKIRIKTDLFRRVDEKNVREILYRVSTANISDALHRQKNLSGLKTMLAGARIAGQAVTVRTCPGDWAKPVEAIDIAERGNVIVVDAGGVGPAVWGELASCSAKEKGLSGVIINGAIRDIPDIKKIKFPAFAVLRSPQAGEPKGFGEINVPVVIDGTRIMPGDWVVADDDGVMVIPKRDAAEAANRAMDVLERENRIRAEIKKGKTTLGKVTELLKWEKK